MPNEGETLRQEAQSLQEEFAGQMRRNCAVGRTPCRLLVWEGPKCLRT